MGLETKRPPAGGRVVYCLVVSPPVFLEADFFIFLVFVFVFVFFIVSLDIVSPLVAAGAVVVPDLSWAKAVDVRKATAAVAMMILRMRRAPLFFMSGRRTITEQNYSGSSSTISYL